MTDKGEMWVWMRMIWWAWSAATHESIEYTFEVEAEEIRMNQLRWICSRDAVKVALTSSDPFSIFSLSGIYRSRVWQISRGRVREERIKMTSTLNRRQERLTTRSTSRLTVKTSSFKAERSKFNIWNDKPRVREEKKQNREAVETERKGSWSEASQSSTYRPRFPSTFDQVYV